MPHHRIVVGLDDSPAAGQALRWAVREALRRTAVVLVVTAWPAADRAPARLANRLVTERIRLHEMQRRAIEAATADLPAPPRVVRELVLADPVTALCHAADFADLVVLGDRSDRSETTGCVTAPGQPPGSGADRRTTGDLLTDRLSGRRARGTRVPPVLLVTGCGAAHGPADRARETAPWPVQETAPWPVGPAQEGPKVPGTRGPTGPACTRVAGRPIDLSPGSSGARHEEGTWER